MGLAVGTTKNILAASELPPYLLKKIKCAILSGNEATHNLSNMTAQP